MARAYYMLMASLPHLPHFRRAERLPINRERLRWRRSALDPADAAQLDGALDLLHWARQPAARSDAAVDRLFRHVLERTRNAALRCFVDERMGERSVVAGLRRKQSGLGPPAEGEICGVGRWDGLLKRRWERGDFGLSAIFPWLGQARQLLAQGDALALEGLLMDALWARLSRVEERHPFGFEAVFAYVFKWDILDRWLSHDRDGAAKAFARLVEETIGEQQLVYA